MMLITDKIIDLDYEQQKESVLKDTNNKYTRSVFF